jgi:hypothetical protein
LLSIKSFTKKALHKTFQITEVQLEIALGILLSENRITHNHAAYEITPSGKIYLETCFNSVLR